MSIINLLKFVMQLPGLLAANTICDDAVNVRAIDTGQFHYVA